MGFITDILKFLSELLKVKDTNTVAAAGTVVLLLVLSFLFVHFIKVFTKSLFEKSFLRKDQQFLQEFSKFLYAFVLFNFTCFTWSWFVSENFDNDQLPFVVEILFIAAVYSFLPMIGVLIVSIAVKFVQKKCIHMKPGKVTNLIYKSIMYICLVEFYLFYLLILYSYFETRNKSGSYFSFFGVMAIFLLASFLVFLFFGKFIIDFFELMETSFTSVILNDETLGPLYVLYGLDSKNLVLGDNTTESKSKKLYLYNLEKKDAVEFEVKLIKPDTEEIGTNGDDLPSRKKRR